MNCLQRIATMSETDIQSIQALEYAMEQAPQVDIPLEHHLHAGIYSRTAFIPKGVSVAGALIKCPTQLIITGDISVIFGGIDPIRLTGFNVVEASAGRKQVFTAHDDSTITMMFATNATTVEEAEEEFTNEYHKLQSRRQT